MVPTKNHSKQKKSTICLVGYI